MTAAGIPAIEIQAARSEELRHREALASSSRALVRRQLETGQHDFTNRADWLAACREYGLVI